MFLLFYYFHVIYQKHNGSSANASLDAVAYSGSWKRIVHPPSLD
jgi:hypothetical protein